MTGARRRALLLIAIGIIAAATLVLAQMSGGRLGPRAEKPTLLLLTSLPLMFSEDFSLEGGGSAALKKLHSRYRVVPISVTDQSELAKGRLLMMAQPHAQTAENLVALDEWVRRGGRVLLLADPMLEWPSKRALGDPQRPPPMFADTGLLLHWGVRLDAPDKRGPARELGGHRVASVSPGLLYGGCAITADRMVARCKVGRGEATVVADADLLIGGDDNLDAVLAELAKLESK
jgi:hypothetical protein